LNKKILNTIKYVGALVIAIGLLYLAFKNVDLKQFWAKTNEVNFTFIYISMAISIVPYWLRAYRWNLLLETMGYKHLTAKRTSIAVVIGYLANLALPRMGEITRCGVLQRNEDVKFSEGLGTVILERIIDGLTLIGIIVVTFIMEFDRLKAFFEENIFSKINLSLTQVLALGIVGLILFLVAIWAWKKLNKSNTEESKVLAFIKETLNALTSIRKVKSPFGFIASTILIWVFYYFMSYIIVFSLPETSNLGWVVGLSLLVTGGIGMAAPVQGGIGTFHLLVSAMLISYGVESQTGLFLATLLHTSQLLAVIVLGGIALIVSLLIKRRQSEAVDQ
jgi:uncharacterized protein (TIRG00374 family)